MTNLVRFAHVRKPRLNYTVAYSFEKQGDTLNITYGVAQCSRADTFSRKGGRERAQARLFKAALGKQPANGNSPHFYGTLSVANTEGLSVGRTVSAHFEAERKAVLAESNRPNVTV